MFEGKKIVIEYRNELNDTGWNGFLHRNFAKHDRKWRGFESTAHNRLKDKTNILNAYNIRWATIFSPGQRGSAQPSIEKKISIRLKRKTMITNFKVVSNLFCFTFPFLTDPAEFPFPFLCDVIKLMSTPQKCLCFYFPYPWQADEKKRRNATAQGFVLNQTHKRSNTILWVLLKVQIKNRAVQHQQHHYHHNSFVWEKKHKFATWISAKTSHEPKWCAQTVKCNEWRRDRMNDGFNNQHFSIH